MEVNTFILGFESKKEKEAVLDKLVSQYGFNKKDMGIRRFMVFIEDKAVHIELKNIEKWLTADIVKLRNLKKKGELTTTVAKEVCPQYGPEGLKQVLKIVETMETEYPEEKKFYKLDEYLSLLGNILKKHYEVFKEDTCLTRRYMYVVKTENKAVAQMFFEDYTKKTHGGFVKLLQL